MSADMERSTGTPPVEWRHLLDPLDYDGCPFQRMVSVGAERDRETASAPVSGATSTTAMHGYPLPV